MSWRAAYAMGLGAVLFGLWSAPIAKADDQQLVEDYLKGRGAAFGAAFSTRAAKPRFLRGSLVSLREMAAVLAQFTRTPFGSNVSIGNYAVKCTRIAGDGRRFHSARSR